MQGEDTIAAPATAFGAGAVALTRISGPRAIDVAEAVFRGRRRVKDLPPGRVVTGRPLPLHEAVQTAVESTDDFGAGPQHQMKGIGEDQLRAERGQLVGRHGLHGRVGSNRCERRRIDAAARE